MTKNYELIFQPRPTILYNQKTSLNTVKHMSQLNVTSQPSTNQLKPLLHVHYYINNEITIQLNPQQNKATYSNQPYPVLAVEVITMINVGPMIALPNAQPGANSAITAKFLTILHLYVDRNYLNQPVLLSLRFIMTRNRMHITQSHQSKI